MSQEFAEAVGDDWCDNQAKRGVPNKSFEKRHVWSNLIQEGAILADGVKFDIQTQTSTDRVESGEMETAAHK